MLKNYNEKFAYLLSQNGIGSVKAEQIMKYKGGHVQPSTDFFQNLYCNQYLEKLLGKYELQLIHSSDFNYPNLLKNITYSPQMLFVIGNVSLLKQNKVTIVGTRDITSYGKRIIADILTLTNIPSLVYVSGLANGVDAEIHRTALRNNLSTIAVVAGGIDQGFPKSNERLYKEIVQSGRGLIVSEFPPGRLPVKGMFPMRNRILAGLSDLTIVVEAGEKSGAMITAQYALDFGREVGTFPNSIFDKTFDGNNKLLEDGAHILTSKGSYLQLLNKSLKLNISEKTQALNSRVNLNSFPKPIQKYFIDLEAKGMGEFSFENMLSYINKIEKIPAENLHSYLTKAEMQGILSLNNLGSYKIKRV